MPALIKVAAVSFRPEIRNMLQRYVGGILKEVGVVRACSPEEAMDSEFDLYVVYTMGTVFTQLSEKISLEKMVPVELFPVPAGMKKVLSLPEESRLGILAGHVWCAADFLRQLIEIGVRNYYFFTGTPEMCSSLDVDWFVVPEEIAPYVNDPAAIKKMVVVPRVMEAQSVAKIIKMALKIKESKR